MDEDDVTELLTVLEEHLGEVEDDPRERFYQDCEEDPWFWRLYQ